MPALGGIPETSPAAARHDEDTTMSNDRGGAARRGRKPAPAGNKINWRRLLIEVGIAIGVINILAGFLVWYFVLPRTHH